MGTSVATALEDSRDREPFPAARSILLPLVPSALLPLRFLRPLTAEGPLESFLTRAILTEVEDRPPFSCCSVVVTSSPSSTVVTTVGVASLPLQLLALRWPVNLKKTKQKFVTAFGKQILSLFVYQKFSRCAAATVGGGGGGVGGGPARLLPLV